MTPYERVILKSIELFTHYGIRMVTMDQIAEAAGMSKRTIYELFKDKDTLVKECIEVMYLEHSQQVQEILSSATNIIEALYKLGQHGEKKKMTLNRLFFDDIRKLYPQLYDTMMQRTKPGVGSFSYRILKQGIEEGIFRSDINIEIVDTFMYVIMETFHNKDMFPEDTSDNDFIKNILVPYYLGISTETGKKLIEEHVRLLYS
jgi:AcrR family transcriptional regulator